MTQTVAFGPELRRWRETRRLSQLALAGSAEVSQRHLSYLETGKSRPSREMVLHLGRTMELSLRDQNGLLAAAGFSPEYGERGLDDPDLDAVRTVLETVLEAHGPVPVYVVDRGWDLVMANHAALSLSTLAAVEPPPEVAANIMRLSLHPEGIRANVIDWERFATVVMHRLERELVDRPHDSRLAALCAEARTYPGVADLPGRPSLPSGSDLVVPLRLHTPHGPVSFVTTIATIGAPFDVTLEELRIETLLPADRHTEGVLRETLGTGSGDAAGDAAPS